MAINPHFQSIRVLIKGAGDLGSGVVARLHRAGFPVVVTEIAAPTMVRRAVCFGSAIYEGQITVEEITAVRSRPDRVEAELAAGRIPVVVDPAAALRATWQPLVLVDAIIAKRNTGTTIDDAPLVVALGPGFTAGGDCHAVIETNRGHSLGRVIRAGSAEADTGVPGSMQGRTRSRVLRAPAEGFVEPAAAIGDRLAEGALVATVAGQPIHAPFDGVLRGLIHPQVPVQPGMKIGDVDPRAQVDHCFTISDKSLAIGGGVLAAILAAAVVRDKMGSS